MSCGDGERGASSTESEIVIFDLVSEEGGDCGVVL
jgi:hypothetical protein